MGKYVIVEVQFRDNQTRPQTAFEGKTYEYYAEGSVEELADKKFAVVDSPYNGYVVARVVKVKDALELDFRGNCKPIIALFNDDFLIAERDRKKRLANLDRQLEEAIAKQSKLAVLTRLASEDPSYIELLEEYKRLIN